MRVLTDAVVFAQVCVEAFVDVVCTGGTRESRQTFTPIPVIQCLTGGSVTTWL